MNWTVKAACVCHSGRVRRNNEDNFYFDGQCLESDNRGLPEVLTAGSCGESPFCAAVFDGVGGESFGERASCAAAKRMQELLRKRNPQSWEPDMLSRELNLAVVREKERLLANRMGTTMASVRICADRVSACNLGDSRIYRFRSRMLRQISRDHTDDHPTALPGKAAITQYLGINPEEMRLEPYVFEDTVQPGDRYLLCSDGLTDMMTDAEITRILEEEPDCRKAVSGLLEGALMRGGADNVTVILADILPDSAGKRIREWIRHRLGRA